MRNRAAAFQFKPFSYKQKKLLSWWTKKSPYNDYDMIICDGSIRSGKTVSMVDSFITWSLDHFQDQSFIIAGRSMGALKRNVLQPMFQILAAKGIAYRYHRSENYVMIGSNTYFCFGASTEASQDVLQGLTAAGAYMDEVALFPRSFVEQAIGRCSVEGSKVWMNCNPDGPYHYIKQEYIDKAEEKHILHLHFTLDDNPSLSEKVKQRYKRMFSGVFYSRYILGLWVMAEGVIYSMFDSDSHVVDRLPELKRTWIGVDHGTSNATTFILCGLGVDNRLYVVDEYYHSGRETNMQKSPSAYSDDFKRRFAEWEEDFLRPTRTFVDPAAKAFMVEMWSRHKIPGLSQAVNDVKTGIELVQNLMNMDMFRVHKRCVNVSRELNSYVWDEKAQERGEDKPIKQNDHCLDSIRYIVNSTAKLWRDIMKMEVRQ
jgi:PBSX family phage terminase large subunit